MAQKTFKIGEYAIGGIITAKVEGIKVDIKALDWNTKEVVMEDFFLVKDSFHFDNYGNLDEYLNYLTSSYYAEKVLNWIKANVKLN